MALYSCCTFKSFKEYEADNYTNFIQVFKFVHEHLKYEQREDIARAKALDLRKENPLNMYKPTISLLYAVGIAALWQVISCLVLFFINIDRSNDNISLNFQFLSLNIVISSLMIFYIFSHILYSFIIISRSFDQIEVPFTNFSLSLSTLSKVRNLFILNAFLTVVCVIVFLIFLSLLFVENKRVCAAVINCVGFAYIICLTLALILCVYQCIKCIKTILSVPLELKLKTGVPKALRQGKKQYPYDYYKATMIQLSMSLLFTVIFLLTQISLSIYHVFVLNYNDFDVFLHQFIEIGLNFVFVAGWMMIYCKNYNDTMREYEYIHNKGGVIIQLSSIETAEPHNVVAQQAYFDQDLQSDELCIDHGSILN